MQTSATATVSPCRRGVSRVLGWPTETVIKRDVVPDKSFRSGFIASSVFQANPSSRVFILLLKSPRQTVAYSTIIDLKSALKIFRTRTLSPARDDDTVEQRAELLRKPRSVCAVGRRIHEPRSIEIFHLSCLKNEQINNPRC